MRRSLSNVKVILLGSLFAISSCSVKGERENVKKDDFSEFYGSQGVVTFVSSDSCLDSVVSINNLDGSEYCSISFTEEWIFCDGKKISSVNIESVREIVGFDPFEFYADYYILKLEYERIDADTAYVYVDKGKEHLKKIVLGDCLVAETWEDYFIGSMVNFDPIENPLRANPRDDAKTVDASLNYDDYLFVIRRVKGEWIQVQCATICGFDCEVSINGWIRWRNKQKQLVTLPSAC